MALTLPEPGRKRWLFLAAWAIVLGAVGAFYMKLISGQTATLLICLQYAGIRILGV